MSTTPAAKSNTAQIELERTPPPCDRCRHPSLVIVEKLVVITEPAGRYSQRPFPLSFCGNHFGFFEALLVLGGWAIVADTRAQLAAREAARKIGGLR